jgi:hypothetical protein
VFDQDGDIEIIKIPKNSGNSTNKLFFKDDKINLATVFAEFNAM